MAYPVISAALPAEISVTPAYRSVEKGQEFNIDISIDPHNKSITGAQFNLYFNSSLVNLENATEGNLFKQNGANTAFNSGNLNNSRGILINVWGLIIISGANVSTKGTLATITMTATETGTSDFSLSNVIISDPGSQAVQVNITNGSVEVTSPNIILQTISVFGGGGGGAGGASGENHTNIELKEKYDHFIYKDITTSYCFKKAGNPISCINVTGNVNAGEINTAVEVLRDTSTLVDASPGGLVYRNVNIWIGASGFATPRNIKEATITFIVDRSWINEHNIDPASISLMRYSGGWYALPTQRTGENDAEIYYEAITDGFAHFAITSDGKGIVENGQDLTPDTESSMQQENIMQNNEEVPDEPGNPGNLNTILLSGVFVGGVINATLILFKMNTKGRTDIFRIA